MAGVISRVISDTRLATCARLQGSRHLLARAEFDCWCDLEARKVDVRLPGKGNSNSHGARPVHPIITMIKWTSRL